MIVKFKKTISTLLISMGLFLQVNSVLAAAPVKKQEPALEDCAVHAIKDIDNKFLTRKEEIAKYDAALYDSVKKRERCAQKAMEQDMKSANSMTRNGAESGSSSGSVTGGNNDSNQSDKTSAENQSNTDLAKQKAAIKVPVANGTIPKDIPPADNDTVLQKQIRAAALEEKDPEKRKKLWDMYRKYKH